MDATLAGGLPTTWIGVGTVFAALGALLAVATRAPRVAARSRAPAPKLAGAVPIELPDPHPWVTASQIPQDDQLDVALAAYSYHRRRQTKDRPPTEPSPWSTAGRLAQIAPFRRSPWSASGH